MYRGILNIAVALFCCLLTSCFGVSYVDLGNHYAWLDNRIIVKMKGETGNCLLYDLIIRPQVLNYAFDDKHIIAYQAYDGSDYYDCDETEEKKDSLLLQFEKLKEMKFCYWIIDKNNDRIVGPMAKTEFEKRCKAMHVEVKMQRSDEREYCETIYDTPATPDSER